MIQYAFSKNSVHNTCNYNSNLVCMPIGRTSGIDPRVLLSLDWPGPVNLKPTFVSLLSEFLSLEHIITYAYRICGNFFCGLGTNISVDSYQTCLICATVFKQFLLNSFKKVSG